MLMFLFCALRFKILLPHENEGLVKALQRHKRCCRSRVAQVVGEEETRIRPTRITARCQRKLLCVIAMQPCKSSNVTPFSMSILRGLMLLIDIREETDTMFLIQFGLTRESR